MVSMLLIVLSATPEAEVARIQEHLRGASALLASRDVSGLSREQLRNRQVNAQRVLDYTAAARFPKNHLVPGISPVFRDEEGTLCAVGALLWASGEHAIVEHIVATRNTATVWQLADEPGLAQWLETQGITLAEAARIQPGYAFEKFTVTTPSYVVGLGACSPPVQLQPNDPSSADYSASVSSSSRTTEFFSDAACSTALRDRSIKLAAAFYFRETKSGRLTLTLNNLGATVKQEHEILLPDGGSVDAEPFDAGPAGPIAEGPVAQRGCSSTDPSLLFTALALIGMIRRDRGRARSFSGRDTLTPTLSHWERETQRRMR